MWNIFFKFSTRYSIDRNTDLERYFNIDANSGVITTAKLLDRETNAVHNITVLAMENRKLKGLKWHERGRDRQGVYQRKM